MTSTIRGLVAATLSCTLAFLTSPWPSAKLAAQTLGQPINLTIVNPSRGAHEIEVIDNVCQRVVLSKVLVGNGMIPIQVCSEGMDRGDVTIRNLLDGETVRFDDVMGGTRLQAP